jgi:hypothetical protein
MKETTRKILSVLASAAEGEAVELPLARDLYPDPSVRAAAEAFQPFCDVSVPPSADSAPAKLTVTVRPEYRSECRQILGEFLNFLLNHAVSGISDRVEDRA